MEAVGDGDSHAVPQDVLAWWVAGLAVVAGSLYLAERRAQSRERDAARQREAVAARRAAVREAEAEELKEAARERRERDAKQRERRRAARDPTLRERLRRDDLLAAWPDDGSGQAFALRLPSGKAARRRFAETAPVAALFAWAADAAEANGPFALVQPALGGVTPVLSLAWSRHLDEATLSEVGLAPGPLMLRPDDE